MAKEGWWYSASWEGVECACPDGVGWRYRASRGCVERACSDGLVWRVIASREVGNVKVLTVEK